MSKLSTQVPNFHNKGLKKLLKKAAKQGWKFKERSGNGNHIQCFAPNKIGIVTVAVTPKSCSLDKVKKDFIRNGLKL